MILHSLMAGFAVYLIAGMFIQMHVELVMVLTFATFVTIVVHLITLAIEMTTTHSTDDAHAVAKMITSGEFSRAFWLGMLLVGNILPMFLLMTGSRFGFALAGVLILAGIYIGERIWVKAPQMIPLS